MATATDRPDGFDAALVAYLPKLRRRAKMIARGWADELVQDTVTMMLEKADQCRMETFKTWAKIIMLRVSSNQKRIRNTKMRAHVNVPETVAYVIGTDPMQEDATDLSIVVAKLVTIQDGESLIREAMGDTLTEMGIERGISREAMRQRRELARLRLNDKMRWAA